MRSRQKQFHHYETLPEADTITPITATGPVAGHNQMEMP